MNKVEALAEIVGGKAELARICEITPAIISRSVKRGRLSPIHNRRLMTWASEHGRGDEIMPLLEPDVCPTCGQPLRGLVI
jgi:hypothetical protein